MWKAGCFHQRSKTLPSCQTIEGHLGRTRRSSLSSQAVTTWPQTQASFVISPDWKGSLGENLIGTSVEPPQSPTMSAQSSPVRNDT